MVNLKYILGLLCIVLAVHSVGCTSFQNKAMKEEEKQRIEQRKKHYALLVKNIKEGRIKNGMTTSEVIELYGEPSDTFRSGSSVSSMDIWTYEKIMEDPRDEDWHPIRLYFANDKLLRWTY